MTEQTSGSGRTLILLRHAKAEREAGLADIDRPLTARGRGDALAAGVWLAHHGVPPDQVLCSPSRRTRQTWEGVSWGIAQASEAAARTAGHQPTTTGYGGPSTSYEPAVWYEPAIYHGTMGDLLKLLRQVRPETSTLLLVGHNPTISELSDLLDPAHAEAGGMRTCGIAVHRLGDGWADLRPGAAPVDRRHTARAS